ncbi:MAG: prefoldin subunit alpha [Candidatus Heimdallarchaeota archaeon]|nr:prefoldin subunit alpha [Candidatus Heimdallarchaeota archaeon]
MSQQAPSPEQVYQQYQTVVEQIQILESQLDNINSVLGDFETSVLTINGIKANDADEEIIIPLGGLISIKAKLTGIKEILLSVGSGVVVPINPDRAIDYIVGRKTEMMEYRKKLMEDHQKLADIAQNLQNYLNQLQRAG